MYPLSFYFNSVDVIGLDPDATAIITGCRYAPGKGALGVAPAGETITETMDLVLQGTWANISLRIRALEELLELARTAPVKKDYVYLRYYAEGVSYDWRSRVVGGRLEMGGHGLVDRDTESQHVILTIVRLNYWFKPRCVAPMFAYGQAEPGLSVLDSINIYGYHLDGSVDGHVNCFGLCGHLSEGDLPSPVELEIWNPYGADAIRNLTISQRTLIGTARADFPCLDDDDMTQGADATLTRTDDAGCSLGKFARIAWNGTAESQLFTVAYTAPAVDVLRGTVQRGVVRLANMIAYTDLWVCLKALYPGTSTVLEESLWVLVPAGTKYFELPPLAMPAALAAPGTGYYNRMTIGLYGRRATAGAHTLDIDYIQFMQAEGLRHLTDISNGGALGMGGKLVDSGIDESCYFKVLDQSEITHVGNGRFLSVLPGYDSMVRVVHRAGGDGAWTIGIRVKVQAYYEPRRRNL